MIGPFSGKASFINGEFVTGQDPLPVVNPATEEVIAEVESATGRQVVEAIAAARQAFDAGAWSGLSREKRASFIAAMLDYLEQRVDLIRKIVVAETGCPVASPIMAVQSIVPIVQTRQLLAYYLKLPETEQNPVPLLERIAPNGKFVDSTKCYVPVGVVSAITAYNVPLFMNLWKAVPALLAGNTVILRPSPLTPLSALIVAEAARAAGLPAGVLNVVIDAGHESGITLTSHPDVDMVTFTGSSVVGERVAAQAAKGIKRLQLELGGKSAQIYLPDRLEDVRGAAASVCALHAGQGCSLGTRILVPSDRKQALMEQMRPAIENLVIGDPADAKTQMGPVISAAQRERCERIVTAAVDAGARVVAGGSRPAHLARGYYFEPTILDLPDNANPAAQEEIFGPVVGVIGYDSIDHAVEIANGTAFGLSGYVFGHDMRQAIQVAQRLRTGTVNINNGMFSTYVSSGGFGASGIGRERGIEGIRIYQQIQVLNISN